MLCFTVIFIFLLSIGRTQNISFKLLLYDKQSSYHKYSNRKYNAMASMCLQIHSFLNVSVQDHFNDQSNEICWTKGETDGGTCIYFVAESGLLPHK